MFPTYHQLENYSNQKSYPTKATTTEIEYDINVIIGVSLNKSALTKMYSWSELILIIIILSLHMNSIISGTYQALLSQYKSTR